MSDELCISMRIGDVCVEVAYPVRGDGALPYAVAVLMNDTADAVLRLYRDMPNADDADALAGDDDADD